MNHWLQKKRGTSVLGLSLDGLRLDGVWVRRTNGSAQVVRTFSIVLTKDLLGPEGGAAALELRQQLDKHEIRERQCAVCLPMSWVLGVSTPLPELPEEDVPEFLDLEAERVFPYAPEDLVMVRSRFQTVSGGKHVMQLAVARENIQKLELALRSARLVPVAFSVGLPLMDQALATQPGSGVTLAVDRCVIGLMVTAGGGIAALRTLATGVEAGEAGPKIDTESLGRELRISLGQLPPDVREVVTQLRVIGSRQFADVLAAGLQSRAATLGLATECPTRYVPGRLGVSIPSDIAPTTELTLALRYVTRSLGDLDFLPPRISGWQTLVGKYSSRKLAYTAMVAGALAAVTVCLFLVQQVQLMRLESQWKEIAPKVREIDEFRLQIKRFRPWYDESFRNLSILKRLAEVFPEDGTVTAKSVELQETGVVSCSGTARDSEALTKMLDQLRSTPSIGEVQVDQLRGRAPLQFTFNFQWANNGRQP